MTANVPGVITNSAFVFGGSADPNFANNTASVTTTVSGANNLFTVTTTNNSGPGSLRQAILDANAHPNGASRDQISFDIPGTGPFTITPTSSLPVISDPVVIDATTQPGFTVRPIVELDGVAAGGTADGFFITGSSTTIRGFAINRFGTGGGLPTDPGGAGIVIQGAGGNVVERNFIGTDVTGTQARPNRSDAVFIDNSPNNRIGGTTSDARNLLSGNSRWGIVLSAAGTIGTAVQGNWIGTDLSGQLPLPNAAGGIFVQGSGSTIGSGAGTNVIAFNGGPGVAVASGTGHRVTNNSIPSNGGLGIDLLNNGVTANDAGDVDSGVNNLQNFPVLTALAGGNVDVALNSTANTVFDIELYASPECDALGNGEGKVLAAFFQMTTNGSGNATATNVPVAPGVYITAIATGPAGSTSEFSACVLTPSSNHPPTANAGPDQTVPLNATVQLDGSGSSDVDNNPLTYLWIFNTKPAGSTAVLSGANTATPTFLADVAGAYVFQLVVNDGLVNSASDLVSISTQNNPPVANAGPDQSNIALNSTVTLNGSGSQDPDGTPVTYAWTLILKPPGARPRCSIPRRCRRCSSPMSPAVIARTDCERRPGAERGRHGGHHHRQPAADGERGPGPERPRRRDGEPERQRLFGPDNNPLTYSWTIFSKPNGSNASLSNATTRRRASSLISLASTSSVWSSTTPLSTAHSTRCRSRRRRARSGWP